MTTPTLQTDRLILRPFTSEDAKDVFECWESDSDVAKYMFWTSHNDIEKTKEWIAFEMGLKVIIPEGTNTTFDNPYMDKEKTCKYYNEFMWSDLFAECISVEETIQQRGGR